MADQNILSMSDAELARIAGVTLEAVPNRQSSPQARPQAAPRQPYGGPMPSNADDVFGALIAQESRGRAGAVGPDTQWGNAIGRTQMLPDTARGVARNLGIPYREDLLRGTSEEAARYQDQLGRAYLQEGFDKTGNARDALMYYHGGPDRSIWGPKTRQYADDVLSKWSSGDVVDPMDAENQTSQMVGDLSQMSDEELMAMLGDDIPEASGAMPEAYAWGASEQEPFDLTNRDELNIQMQEAGRGPKKGDFVRYSRDGETWIGRATSDSVAGTMPGSEEQGSGVFSREVGAPERIGAFAQAASEQVPFLDESVAATTGLLTGRGYDEMRRQQMAQREIDNQSQRGSRVAGGLAGFGGSLLAPGGAFINRGAGLADKAGRAAMVGGGLGALYGAGAADEGGIGNRIEQGAIGGGVGALSGGALQAGGGRLSELVAQRAANRASNPSNARILSNAGVDLLPGQVLGGGLRRMEDAATSIPFMGDAIRSAQRRGLEQLNDAALAEPLQRIGATVPQARGRERIREVSQEFTRAYDNALDPLKAIPRPEGYAEALEAIANNPSLGPQQRRSMRSLIANTVGKAGDEIDGQTWKRIDSELSADINNASRAATNAPENRLLGDALREVRDVWGQRLDAASPGALATVRNIDDAFADFAIVRKAVSDVASAGRGGEASAATLNRAVSQSAGTNRYAQGAGRLQELSDAAANVLPSTVPDSGTPLRSLVTAGGVGGGAMALGNPTGQLAAGLAATGIGLGTAAYSRPALNIFNRLYRASGQDNVSRNLIDRLGAPPQNPAMVPAYLDILESLQGDANAQPAVARR